MAALTIQKLAKTGQVVTFAGASATGDHVILTKDTGYQLRVDIVTAGTVVTTVVGVQRSDQNQLNDHTISVGAAPEQKTIAIPYYAINATSNRCDFTYDNVTNVTVAIVEV
ncbi:MAG: hypothetical protein V3U84_03980 [Thiotrichaceae bacterium]